tara:strand:- start:1105 stop:3639 length:2535 start_codon:yes stop_codon:yes gene_type:complete
VASEKDLKLAKELNAKLEDRKGLAERLNKLSKEDLKNMQESKELHESIRTAVDALVASQVQALDQRKKHVQSLRDELTELNKIDLSEKSRYAQGVIQEEQKRRIKELEEEELKLLNERILAGEKLSDQDEKRLKDLDKQQKKLEKMKNVTEVMTKLTATGLFSGDSSKMTSSLKSIGGSMESKMLKPMEDAIGKADTLGGKFGAMVSLLLVKALLDYAKAAVKLAYDLGNVENAFMKATGANEEFARSVTNSYKEGRRFAATAADMSKATQGLYNEFTDFTFQDKDTREGLIETGAVLEKLGISNQKFAQSVQLSTKALGMSAEGAGQSMLDLEKYAEELGVSPERLSSQFLEAGDSLAKLGENGDEAFRDLAAAAKITGLSVTKLLNIVNQFDTFEGAARQAGKLNAALGGNFVNAMDLMMETDPTARFEQIRDSILDTGLSFDEMSYYQKNFYKDAMGLSSVGDLALVLSGNMDSVSGATKKTSQEYEDAAKRAQTVASFQEQLNILFAEMIPIITPLIDGMRNFFGWMSKNAKIIKVVSGLILTITGAILLFTGAGTAGGIAGVTLGLGLLFDSVEYGEKKMSGLSILFKKLGKALEPLWTDLKLLFEPFMLLFGGPGGEMGLMAIAIPIIEALAVALNYMVLGVKMALAPYTAAAALISDFIKLIQGDLTWENSSVGKWFGGFAQSIAGIISPILELLNYFGLIDDKVEMLGHTMFEKSYASSFLDGIDKFGEGFEHMGSGVNLAITPVTSLIEKMIKLGDSPIFKVGAAIAGWFGNDDTAAATTGAPAAAAAAGTGGTTMINQGPENITIELKVDRDKLATIVHKINGKSSSNAIAGRG